MQEPTQTERALLRVARTLAAAIAVEEITSEITATALELTGATGVYVERVIASDGTVEVIANAGVGTPEYGTRVPYPGSLTEEIIGSGEPLLMDTFESLGKSMAPYLERTCSGCAGLIVPLFSEGDVVGTLVLLRAAGTDRFTDRDASTARVLGDLTSVALRRVIREAIIRDRERDARMAAERDERSANFLVSAGILLASSLDMPTTMQTLAGIVIEDLADWCVIDIVTEDGQLERVAGAHRDPAKQAVLDVLVARYPPLAASENPVSRAFRDGDPVTINGVTSEQLRAISRSDEHAAMAAELGVASILAMPLAMGGTVLGVMTLMRNADTGPFGVDDVSCVQDLASRAALAVSNARHFAAANQSHGEAEQGRQELERVIESKARLIRGFSHDIKNPLGAADGYAQLLVDGLMGELTAKQAESIGRIRAGIATALSLINDVVEFSRAESGQMEVRQSPFNADALVREVIEEHRAEAERSGARLMAGELAGGQITCDAIRIRQILGNLVINAIKYAGGDSPIVLSVRRSDGVVDESSRILFAVADEGQGIPVEKQHLLFEEFQRLHMGKKEGSGLGLAISRRIARVLGGDLTVESAAGRGSTFTLWIPAP